MVCSMHLEVIVICRLLYVAIHDGAFQCPVQCNHLIPQCRHGMWFRRMHSTQYCSCTDFSVTMTGDWKTIMTLSFIDEI